MYRFGKLIININQQTSAKLKKKNTISLDMRTKKIIWNMN